MKNLKTLLLSLSTILLCSCGATDSGNPQKVLANMQNASAVALATANSKSELSGLVKIRENGLVEKVLNTDLSIQFIRKSDSLIVIGGDFGSIIDIKDKTSTCTLIAFEITADDDGVYCLSSSKIGEYNDYPENDPNAWYDGAGFDVHSNIVYFIENSSSGSALRRWELGEESSSKVLSLSGGTGALLTDVYTSSTNSNVCTITPALNSAVGALYCSTGGSSPSWSIVSHPDTFTGSEIVSFNNLVIGYEFALDLNDLSVAGTTYSYLPLDESLFAKGTSYAAGIVSGRALNIWDTSGQGSTLDNTISWERIVGAGDVAWVYGQSNLKKVDLSAGTLDATNYLSSVGLLEVTSMNFISEDVIRLAGTGSSGGATTVFVNVSTGDIEQSSIDNPDLRQIVRID